jgi:murein L,D-transpeptidase YcbB/YkuD
MSSHRRYLPSPRAAMAVSVFGLSLVLFAAPPPPAQADVRPGLLLARISAVEPLRADGLVLDRDALQAFYVKRGYGLAWDGDEAGARATAIGAVLSAADAEGLDPAQYHTAEIAALAGATADADRVDRDLLISDGLLHYLRDVSGGKLTALQTDERITVKPGIDVESSLESAATLDPASLPGFLAAIPPASPVYHALQAMLVVLRPLVAAGGWQALPDGLTIRPDTHDPAIPALRQRLVTEGRLPADPMTSGGAGDNLYAPDLVAAVEAFQTDHGIKPDGTIGKDTRAALDRPAEDRLRQVIVNLERARWEGLPPAGRSVVVNLASYALTVFQDDQVIMAMSVVDGTAENQTPLLETAITTVVLNPTWTLPPIVLKELRGRRARYFARHGIARVSDKEGVRFVQPPGPENPLGRYKFVMPNTLDIYLHDTPDQAKFRFELRNYSHGCVRLDNAQGLAALLLDDKIASFPESLDDMQKAGNTHFIKLSRPVPVSLVYRTAWLDSSGKLLLGLDPYGRDALLWAAIHQTAMSPPDTAPGNTTAAGSL